MRRYNRHTQAIANLISDHDNLARRIASLEQVAIRQAAPTRTPLSESDLAALREHQAKIQRDIAAMAKTLADGFKVNLDATDMARLTRRGEEILRKAGAIGSEAVSARDLLAKVNEPPRTFARGGQIPGFTARDVMDDDRQRAMAWAEYRNDYDVASRNAVAAHKAFRAGWEAARSGPQDGALT